MTSPITVERLENAIRVTAQAMVDHDLWHATDHDLQQLRSTLKRLEAERDKMITEDDPLEYARRMLAACAVA
jgi:hypothetical protein